MKAPALSAGAPAAAVALVQVTLRHGDAAPALQSISFQIRRGEFVFLVGPTGSGKSSLLRLLIRDLLCTTGEIWVEGL